MLTAVRTATMQLVINGSTTPLDLDVLQGLWSDAQYLRLTDSIKQLIEFTDGQLEVLPMPTYKHQAILQLLLVMLHALVRPLGGVESYAPLRLQIRPGKYREPDLLVLLNRTDPRFGNVFWQGADLVMEVVSPDNPTRDTQEKRLDYAEARVPEYWIVDPAEETITVLRLLDAAYAEQGVFQRGDTATSRIVPGLTVVVDTVLDAD